jgi:hypothetical protein
MDGKWLRYVARTVALLWAGLWTLFGLLAGVGEGLDLPGILMHTAVPGLVFLLTVFVAWRWELPGAVLLGLVGLLTLFVFGFARTPEGLALLTLPPLFAGALFLASWRADKRAPSTFI